MLNALIVIKQCLLRPLITNYLKSTPQYGKKLSMNINFDSGLVYGDNDKYSKTKIKSY